MRRAPSAILAVLALLLLAAHFYRAGSHVLAIVSFALVALVFVTRPWAARVLRITLFLGALEWLRTAWMLAGHRAAMGQPYARMLVILFAVALVTVLAAALAGRLGDGQEKGDQ
ncbi:MAG: hypothetical protein FIB04_10850 [Gammaproteobacteria bacterium]|nr:hypothetical protein [Gammaproteobacteria bacterium]